jgi:hypothetical protein
MSEKKNKLWPAGTTRHARRFFKKRARTEDYSLRRPLKTHGGKPPTKTKNPLSRKRRQQARMHAVPDWAKRLVEKYGGHA